MSWGDLAETVHDYHHIVGTNSGILCTGVFCRRRLVSPISSYIYEYRNYYYTSQGYKIGCKQHYNEAWGYCRTNHLATLPTQGTHKAWLASGYVLVNRRLNGNSHLENYLHGNVDEKNWMNQLEELAEASPNLLRVTLLDDERLIEAYRQRENHFFEWERQGMITINRPTVQEYIDSFGINALVHPADCEVCDSRDVGELWLPDTKNYLAKGKAELIRSLALT